MHFKKTIELVEKENCLFDVLDMTATSSEDAIKINLVSLGFLDERLVLTAQEAVQLVYAIEAAITQCQLGKFVEAES